KPSIIESYPGGNILLGNSRYLSVATNPELLQYKGETLVVTDGTTLLGGDDKAGIAQIMAVACKLSDEPTFKHGPVELYFTSDEEVDCGMNFFPYDQSTCTWCYTMDGEKRYLIDTECFNAAAVHILVEGVSYHLGSGRGKIVNAVTIASAIAQALPHAESPEATDERYGYYCPLKIQGTLEKATLDVYVRDFDLKNLNRRIETIKTLASTMSSLYVGSKIHVEATNQYYNLAEEVKKDPRALQIVHDAGKALHMPLQETQIRGGTDGAWMAQARKIPCLNLFTGCYNRHSVYEWVALPAMEEGSLLLLKILELATQY
ncbi:MAG: tripeptide aminopeptidase PepT, partial [Sphaerochaetaceae bacterium]